MIRRTLLAAVAFLAACSGGGTGTQGQPGGTAGTVGLASAAYSVGESASVAITLRRTGGATGQVSVHYAMTPGTAQPSLDYVDDHGTVTWAPGDASDKTITVWTNDDTLVEGDETFFIDLSSPAGGAALGTASATVTIVDNETPAAGAIRFSAPAYSVNEGAGSAVVTVERSGGSTGMVSVLCGTGSGTATPGSDYQPAWGSLVWQDGDTSPRTLTIPILDDASPEPYETVPVELDPNPTGGAAIAGPLSVNLTIRNDDSVVQFGQATFSVGESAGTLSIPVTKIGETPPVDVHFAVTGGTATAGADYAAFVTDTLSWPERDTTAREIQIAILNDAIREGDETIVLSLTSPAAGASIGSPSSATVTIIDDEPPLQGLLEFTKGVYPVSNYAGAVTISVRRTGGTDGTVGVSYATANGTATEGQDYTAALGTLAWGPGDAAEKTFSIPIADDLVVEHSETILLGLSNPTGGAALGPQQSAQAVISDDWTRTGSPVFLDSPTLYAWDEYAVESPSVVRLGPSSFVMYYQGENAVHQRRIGRAVSTDGITWTRQPATAVLSAGAAGKFDEFGVGKPSVLFDGTTWHMWFTNQDNDVNHSVPLAPRIGFAKSSDGITWVRQNGGDPVLDMGSANTWDSEGVSGPTVLLDGGTYEMWYTGQHWGRTQIGYATSSDGVSWTRSAKNPVLPVALAGYDYYSLDPSVVKDGATYRIWYVGDHTYPRLCYATSTDGIAWSTYPGQPIFDVVFSQDWDYYEIAGPSALKDGERWLLWYHSGGGIHTNGAIGLATNP